MIIMQNPQNKPAQDSNAAVSLPNLLTYFSSGLWNLLLNSVSFFLQFKILLILSIVAGIITGVVAYKVVPASYRLTMIVKPTELNGKIFGQMLKSLDDLASSGSSNVLAQNLNIPLDVSKKIKSISGQTLQGIDLIRDTTQNYEKPFIIELHVRDNSVAANMEMAILQYFNLNRYLNKLKNDKTVLFNSKIEYINGELQKLDSLKGAYNNFLTMSRTPTMYYNNVMDPVGAYETSSKLFNERNDLKDWLQQNKEVLVRVDGFKPSRVPNSQGIINFIVIYGSVFFLLGCLGILIFQLIKDTRAKRFAI